MLVSRGCMWVHVIASYDGQGNEWVNTQRDGGWADGCSVGSRSRDAGWIEWVGRWGDGWGWKDAWMGGG